MEVQEEEVGVEQEEFQEEGCLRAVTHLPTDRATVCEGWPPMSRYVPYKIRGKIYQKISGFLVYITHIIIIQHLRNITSLDAVLGCIQNPGLALTSIAPRI